MKILLLSFLVSFGAMAEDFLPSSFSTNYEESFKSAATGKEKRSFGKIDYKFPRHIRFEVVSPDPSSFIANPKTSWYYTPPFVEGEDGQVVIQASSDLVLTKFLDSLKNGAKSNKAYTVAFNKNQLTLTFTAALKKDLQMDKAVLTTKSGEAAKTATLAGFEKLELHHSNGRKVLMKFMDFKSGVSFAAKHFDFVIPSKTKVTQGK